MRAIVFDEPGGPEVLRLGEAPDPEPAEGEALIRVRAAGVNRADLLQRMGRYPPPPGASPILGLEIAGEIEVVSGPDSRWRLGDRVMAVVTGGAYAERAAVPESTLMAVPEAFSFEQAAAIPEAFLTAWLNLVELGRLAAGETVFIHAGASGVGSAAIQVAKAYGATVITSAGSDRKLAFCRELGAAVAVHREREDFVAAVREATGGMGADLILDFVGATVWDRNLAALKRGGRLTLIGFLGGSRGELDLGPVMRKNLTVTGTTLRASSVALKSKLVKDFDAFARPRFASGALRPLLDSVFPLADAAEAHRAMADNRNAGKIVLRVG